MNYVEMNGVIQVSALTILAASISSACNTGWFEFDNSCYKVFSDKRNWQQAKKQCNDNGAHLAIVMSVDENNFLKQKLATLNLPPVEQVWMDGTDSDTEGKYIWSTTGELFEIADWGPGEPNQNAGDEDCLTFFEIYQWKWNDEHCDRQFPYMCEIEQSPGVG